MMISILNFAGFVDGSIIQGGTLGTITGVAIDTREILAGNVFFAFKGKKSDGHIFIEQAKDAGAVAAVVRNDMVGLLNFPVGITIIAVNDVEIALGASAAAFRGEFAPRVTAVTGSVGKTTTREMICTAISSKHNVLTNKRNFNNEIGVPLTLFNMTDAHSSAVIEMGMRGKGQIEYLCNIVKPQIGVITNIGYSHIELLGSQAAIADAKFELFYYLDRQKDACVIYNGDDAYLGERINKLSSAVKRVSFGRAVTNNIYIVSYRATSDGGSAIEYSVHGESVYLGWKHAGMHNAMNAAAALAVACEYGVPIKEAIINLSAFDGIPMRLDTRELADGSVLVNDAYNASPDSTLALLGWMSERKAQRKILVFGNMLELGDFSAEMHEKIGIAAADVADVMVCVGEMAAIAGRAFARRKSDKAYINLCNNQEVAQWLTLYKENDDLIVLKASRGMHFEEISLAIH